MIDVRNGQWLMETGARISEVERNLTQQKLMLKIESTRSTEPNSKKVIQLEKEISTLQASLESLMGERVRMQKDAIDKFSASKRQLSAARQVLAGLILDADVYAINTDLSERFRKELYRVRREAIIKKADVAKDLALRRKRKVIDSELLGLIDDIMEVRTLDVDRDHEHDLKVLARAITDILGQVNMLRRGVNSNKVYEMLWELFKAVVAAATGSSALALYHMLSTMDPAAQAHAGAKVREDVWRAVRNSVTDATPFFAEPVAPRDLFKLLFHVAGPIR